MWINVDTEKCKQTDIEIDANYFGGLGPMNTVGDFITELYDNLFREILGDDIVDRPLCSFEPKEFYEVMAKIFLQDGNQKLFSEIVNKQ